MWRRTIPLLVAVVVTTALAPAGAVASSATSGVLTGDTTIRWTGVKGIRLATPAPGMLPAESMTLFVRGGTYAFVQLVADPQPAACAKDTPWAHCYWFALAKFPRSGEFVFDDGPGADHLTVSVRPPRIMGRRLDAYLFTDGEATLRIRPQGYRGRSSYVAGGRIRGAARLLPGSCAVGCARTGAVDLTAGGLTVDLGNRPGHVVAHAYHVGDATVGPGAPANHPMTVDSCYYPSPEHPRASVDPAAHPTGCDLVPAGTDDAADTLTEVAQSIHLGFASWASWNVGDQIGKRYVGFRAAGAWARPAVNAGYAVWFNYGIT